MFSRNTKNNRIVHFESRNQKLRELAVSAPPEPWLPGKQHAIGGLTEIGYADASDILLVVSSQGRGVFKCLNGELIARNRNVYDDSWYDSTKLTTARAGKAQ